MIRFLTILFIYLWIPSLLVGCHFESAQQDSTKKAMSDTAAMPDFSMIERWEAGSTVDSAIVSAYGIDNLFRADTINDSIFRQMQGSTYHADSPVSISELRYLRILHRNSEGVIMLGELICNKTIASDLLEIFKELFNAGYPIERMVLASRYDGDDESSMNDNNTSCFNSRNIAGSTKPSYHAFGMAVDINPLYNPYVKIRNGEVVKKLPHAAKYPLPHSPYRIEKGDLCYRLFIAHGFKWGGSWRTVKDYQHFEKHK